MVSFIMQADTFWNEVVNLTKSAIVKTEQIQRIVQQANNVILQSKGTQIKMRSLKKHWMEVAEMISSDRNNVVFSGKVV